MLLIIYIVGISIYVILPLPLQLILLVFNTCYNDPIPYIDEIIMYGSTVKKIIKLQWAIEKIQEIVGVIVEWIANHKVQTILICLAFVIIILF